MLNASASIFTVRQAACTKGDDVVGAYTSHRRRKEWTWRRDTDKDKEEASLRTMAGRRGEGEARGSHRGGTSGSGGMGSKVAFSNLGQGNSASEVIASKATRGFVSGTYQIAV